MTLANMKGVHDIICQALRTMWPLQFSNVKFHLVTMKLLYIYNVSFKRRTNEKHLWQWFIFCLLANSLENLLKRMDVYFILIVKS